MPTIRPLLAAALVAAAPVTAAAQFTADSLGPATRTGEPRFQGGLALSIGQPVHEFKRYVKNGVGVHGHLLYRLDRAGVLALRADAGFVNYGRETRRVPISDNIGRVTVDLTTNNNIFWGGIGPQLMVPSGPVRPYVNGSVGFAAFSTTSSLRDRETDQDIFSDENQSDATLATSGGGGLLIPISRSARSLAFIDLGVRYHRNGTVTYLREGGIRDLPGGQVALDRIRSDADLWTWHIGVSIGGR